MKPEIMIDLLKDWLVVCSMWQFVFEKSSKKGKDGYATKKIEKDCYQWVRDEFQDPLQEKCRKHGTTLSVLMGIIPPAFATTVDQRNRILRDLRSFSMEKYNILI